jgi:guanine nucleotide-binding protein subunit alpha
VIQILFLNKEDLFRQKVLTSRIKRYFPDFEGTEADAADGMNYFKRRFLRIHTKAIQTFKNNADSKNSRRPKIPPLPAPVDIRKVYP